MTITAFLERYPEFSSNRAETALITRCLAQAGRHVSGDGWGSQKDDAVGLYAAHLLATSPWGQQTRMTEDGGRTSTYGTQFKELRAAIFPRMSVSCY